MSEPDTNDNAKLPVLIRIEYRRGDLRAAYKEQQKINSRHRRRKRREWAALVLLLSAIVLLRIWISGRDAIASTIIVEGLTVSACLLVLRSGNVKQWAGVWEFELSNERARYCHDSIELTVPWTFFGGFSETEKYLFLWSEENDSPFIFPKSVFKSPEDLNLVLELVKGRLTPLRRRREGRRP